MFVTVAFHGTVSQILSPVKFFGQKQPQAESGQEGHGRLPVAFHPHPEASVSPDTPDDASRKNRLHPGGHQLQAHRDLRFADCSPAVRLFFHAALQHLGLHPVITGLLPLDPDIPVIVHGGPPQIQTYRLIRHQNALTGQTGKRSLKPVEDIPEILSGNHEEVLRLPAVQHSIFAIRRSPVGLLPLLSGKNHLIPAGLIPLRRHFQLPVLQVNQIQHRIAFKPLKNTLRQREYRGFVGQYFRFFKESPVPLLSVHFQFPADIVKLSCGKEIQHIFQGNGSHFPVPARKPHRPGHIFQFQKSRMRSPVRIHQPVHTEIPVVKLLAEIAAVGEFIPAIRRFPHIDGVVAPFPYKSARIAVILIHSGEIILQIPGAVAHGVAVLHHHQRLFPLLGTEPVHKLRRRVHPAVHIQTADIVGFSVFYPDGIFIVENPGRIEGFHPSGGLLHADPVAAFISQRPGNHAAVVPVPVYHPLHPVQNRFREPGILHGHAVGDILLKFRVPVLRSASAVQIQAAIGFHIRLIHHIKAQAVTFVQRPGRIGIMAGPDGVDIMFLHQPQVSQELFPGNHSSGEGIAVMAVDAFQLELLPVQQQHISPGFHLPDGHLLADELSLTLHHQIIEIGLLRVPQPRLVDDKFRRLPVAAGCLGKAALSFFIQKTQ